MPLIDENSGGEAGSVLQADADGVLGLPRCGDAESEARSVMTIALAARAEPAWIEVIANIRTEQKSGRVKIFELRATRKNFAEKSRSYISDGVGTGWIGI